MATCAGALAIAFIPAPAPGPAPGTGTAPGHKVLAHDGALTESQQRSVSSYWTPARMRAAVPAGTAGTAGTAAGSGAVRPAARGTWLDGNTKGRGLRWVHGGAADQAAGKVFFTLNGTDYVCSGTVIRSPHADVVLTAAHCVGDSNRDWATNWTFVPGYQAGSRPYGSFTARRFFVSSQWAGSRAGSARAEEYDFAFVTVNPAAANPAAAPAGKDSQAGAAAAQMPAGQPVAFTGMPTAATPVYVFGYPAQPPFSGLYANYCAGPTVAARLNGTVGLRCQMTAGDSGGPWLAGFDPRSGTGTVVAVTTFKYTGHPSVLYATVLGPAARKLYNEASALAAP